MGISIRILGFVVFCSLPFKQATVQAQVGNYSSFLVMQSVQIDTAYPIDPSAAIWCPGIPIKKQAATQFAFFRLMGFKNWQQLSITAKRQFQASSALLQVAVEKLPTGFTTSQLALQFSRLLGANYSVGVQLGVLRRQFHFYHPISIPFAQVGSWTALSPSVKYAMSVGFSGREVPINWQRRQFVLLLRSLTSFQVTKSLAFNLQLEKLSTQRFYWQVGLGMLAGPALHLQFSYAASPQWWILHFQFPLKQIDLKISLGFQPMLGTVSGFNALR